VDPAVTPKGYVEKPVVNRTKSIYNKNWYENILFFIICFH
jgi:hypothetical protein